MPVQICAYCGTAFPGAPNAKYCNRDCYRKACKEAAAERGKAPEIEPCVNACRFNIGVNCPDQEGCSQCGWNPEVAHLRLARIRVRLLEVEVKSDAE